MARKAPVSTEFIDTEADESSDDLSSDSDLSTSSSGLSTLEGSRLSNTPPLGILEGPEATVKDAHSKTQKKRTRKPKSAIKPSSKPEPKTPKAPEPRKKKADTLAQAPNELTPLADLAPTIIRYNISVFTAAERLKEMKKKNGKNTYMKLHAEEPFDTWKAQLLVRIERILSPTTLDIMHYEVNFSVPRIQPSPMAVSQEEEYTDMIERVSKSKEHICTIYVQELQALSKRKRGKENQPDTIDEGADDEGDSESEPPKTKKQKKSKAPKALDIKNANVPHNNNIKALRERWMCHQKPGCASEHCFINPVDASHLPLGHPHFDVWGAAMLKGDDFATLDTPPNHHLFNALSNNQLGQRSPLLERRQRGSSNSGPVFNFNIPNEFAQLLRPPAHALAVPAAIPCSVLPVNPLPVPMPALAPASVPSQTAFVSTAHNLIAHVPVPNLLSLIPADRVPGPELLLDDFCLKYGLTEGVRNKLEENGYSGSHTFQYAEWSDLKDAGLKAGEVAQLKHAISKWSTPRLGA